MLAEQRYKEISEILEREGSVKTVTLCGILGTSRETVRRDLETMEERNMLKRIHGGAMRMEPAVADELRGAKGISLVLTGGLYKADEDAFVSDIATLIFSRINIDVFFLTTCGISVERGITYQRMDEIQVQNSMMEAAEETIVIADSSKLGVNSLVRMCGVEEISRLITDSGITKRQADDFKAAGVRVTVAEERKEEES